NCNFCSVTKFWGPKIRTKPLENVEKELLQIKSLGTNRIFFTDDNFIADISYTKNLLDLLKKHDFSWICQVSTNIYRHEDLIVEMSKAGCSALYMGIETFSEENLEDINKKFNKMADYETLFALFNKSNIRVTASMIIGLDGDTRETLDNMLQRLIHLRVSYAQFFLLQLLPGTQIREQFLRENRIIDHNWDHQNGTQVTFQPRSFQVEELQDYYWNLNKKFYSYKSIFRRLITLSKFKGGINSIIVPLKSNLYFLKKLNNGLHPIEN
ncbi:MAG: radical SAM protein, partial [Deltaproteobacteria bacterium]|nr:radical SAM protein [Deltaproteobacteria bacterium]